MSLEWSADKTDVGSYRKRSKRDRLLSETTASTNHGKIKLFVPSTEDDHKMRTPDHYDFPIQPVDYIIANNLGFCEGNVIKYVSRWQGKGGRDDLLKAKHYIEMLIDTLDKESAELYNTKDNF